WEGRKTDGCDVVLDEGGRRIKLGKFLLGARDRRQCGIKHDRASRRRALVDGEKIIGQKVHQRYRDRKRQGAAPISIHLSRGLLIGRWRGRDIIQSPCPPSRLPSAHVLRAKNASPASYAATARRLRSVPIPAASDSALPQA